MSTTHTIGSADVQLTLTTRGTSWLACRVRRAGRDGDGDGDAAFADVMPACTGDAPPLTECSFLMLPYSNRIKDGRFTFDGKEYQLKSTANHALHGDVRNREWEVRECTSDTARYSFRSTDHAGVDWPWPFEAEASYKVEPLPDGTRGGRLLCELQLRNLGDTPMPAGGGWHPYFNRSLLADGAPETPTLTVDLAGVYPADENMIPTGRIQPPPPHLDFAGGKPIDPTIHWDVCCFGLSHNAATLRWPESRVTVTMHGSDNVTHLVLYNPIDKPFFAVEPVLNANDGVNLHARRDMTSGVQSLPPGETLTARCAMEFRVG